MNKLYLGLISLVLLGGCFSSPSRASSAVEAPRREFQSIESDLFHAKEPAIVNDFSADDVLFRIGSINFSTALFLADMGILADVPKDLFEKYAAVLFTQFPGEGEVKEIVIPGISLSEKEDAEKDAYIFITKTSNSEGRDYYLVETNIPIASMYSSIYDGYVMNMGQGFYRNKVPARWVSIMSIMINDDVVLYRGVAYPSMAAPLIFTGKGIGSDARMNSVVSGQATVRETADILKDTVDQVLQNTVTNNQEQADSMKFLEKSTYMSLSAYRYIDSDWEEARNYFKLSQEIEANIPENTMGSRHRELEKIMDYLLNTADV